MPPILAIFRSAITPSKASVWSNSESLLPIPGKSNGISQTSQEFFQEELNLRLIIDDENLG